jgi:Fe-S-cluster containining protein
MTECNRCGDCCERITFTDSWTSLQEWADWARNWREWAWYNLLDGEDGGMEQGELDRVANAEFLLAHWRPAAEDAALPMPRFTCDAFDPTTRLCTAHESRPPICSGYPWYGRAPREVDVENRIGSLRCSFWADVPLDQRPGASLRLLPVLQSGGS